jgi:hypothetical protein
MPVLAVKEQLATIEATLDLTHGDLAHILGVELRTLRRWDESKNVPQRNQRVQLDALETFAGHLNEMFATRESALAWLHGHSRYLAGLTPAEVIRAGRIDRAEAALEALDSGVFI